MTKRTESDFIGHIDIQADALYGIHSYRASQNFPNTIPFHPEWYKAIGLVKQACYQTYSSFKNAASSKYDLNSLPISFIDDNIVQSLNLAAEEVANGKHFNHFIVPAISGGAGTSINMNVNEIISNLALKKLGHAYGDYNIVDPIEHANIFQSTNDVIPTSLKIAIMYLLGDLENSINHLRRNIEKLETKYRDIPRLGYTQMQEAVPSSYGKLFSAYNDALSRDWWRVSKCFERIKIVNLGGGAIGTGISIPRYFIMEVVSQLQKLTKLPITRGENLCDITSNLDSLVEVHAIMKSHAVNIEKMVSDIRLLSSDIIRQKEISIPRKQVGSSIMPGKVNPVIPEYVISLAHKVYSNDMLITSLSSQGCLDLNPYLPTIGHAILESLKLLISANNTMADNLFETLLIETDTAQHKLLNSPSLTTALIPYIGYHNAAKLANIMKQQHVDIYQANVIEPLITNEQLTKIISPSNLLKLGYSLDDL